MTRSIADVEADMAAMTARPELTETPQGRAALQELTDAVAALSRSGREDRVVRLIERAHGQLARAYDLAETDKGPREVSGVVSMFSGGNDSTVLAHLFRDRASHVGVANTGIGVPATRSYVRDVSAGWGLPVIEKSPPEGSTFRDLVLGRAVARTGPKAGTRVYPGGFPGPGAHAMMFQRLKERAFEQIRTELVPRPREQRVIFLAGRRATESVRRNRLAFRSSVERKYSIVWCAPLVEWTTLDMNTYRLMHAASSAPVPVNEVSQLIHMSGECLCGCFAEENELQMIGEWFPDVRAEIEKLEAEVREENPPGVQRNPRAATWGWGWAKDKPAGCECRSA